MAKDLLIGFIGQGFIGKNMADDFVERDYRVIRYDNRDNYINKDKIGDCDYVFIAVPTPSTPAGFDDSILEEVLALVGEGKTAVIKSTIKVGTTEKFQKLFPNKFIIHSPEFLREKNAASDSKFPPRNVIGYTNKSKEKAEIVLNILPKAKHSFIINSREAELIKYMGNNFLYFKVVFANMFYNLCKKNDVDYDLVSSIVGLDPRIGTSHLKVSHNSGLDIKAGRGAGGHCFIKDMAALVEMFKDNNLSSEEDILSLKLLESVVELNKQLLIDSDKDINLLKEVYGD